MTKKKAGYVIEIPIDDWVEEFNTIEADVTNEDDLIKGLQSGLKPLQVGRLAITGRELGIAPDDILPTNKLILNTGGAYSISQMVARRHKAVELANGNTVKMREFVGSVREDDEDQEQDENQPAGVQSSEPTDGNPDDLKLVTFDSPEAKERAIKYLERYVMPNIRERFKIIAANAPEELKQIVKDLKKQIDVAVADLV